MHELRIGQSGVVKELDLEPEIYHRLLELGLLKGKPVQKIVDSTYLSCYVICGAKIIIRKNEAKQVLVEI